VYKSNLSVRYERRDLIQAGLDVRLPDPNQWLEVLRQKHQEAEQSRARCLVGAQAAGQESEPTRQTRLAVRGQLGQVLRRAEHEEIHGRKSPHSWRGSFPSNRFRRSSTSAS